jgi:hypothetical protein
VTLETGRGADRSLTGPSPSATPVRSPARHAFCPLCGYARTEIPVSDVRGVEDALCPGRCAVAWRALAALKQRESVDKRVAARRRTEYESGEPHPSALSDILLLRWRAGDWTVTPEDLLLRIPSEQALASELPRGASFRND